MIVKSNKAILIEFVYQILKIAFLKGYNNDYSPILYGILKFNIPEEVL